MKLQEQYVSLQSGNAGKFTSKAPTIAPKLNGIRTYFNQCSKMMVLGETIWRGSKVKSGVDLIYSLGSALGKSGVGLE